MAIYKEDFEIEGWFLDFGIFKNREWNGWKWLDYWGWAIWGTISGLEGEIWDFAWFISVFEDIDNVKFWSLCRDESAIELLAFTISFFSFCHPEHTFCHGISAFFRGL